MLILGCMHILTTLLTPEHLDDVCFLMMVTNPTSLSLCIVFCFVPPSTRFVWCFFRKCWPHIFFSCCLQRLKQHDGSRETIFCQEEMSYYLRYYWVFFALWLSSTCDIVILSLPKKCLGQVALSHPKLGVDYWMISYVILILFDMELQADTTLLHSSTFAGGRLKLSRPRQFPVKSFHGGKLCSTCEVQDHSEK